MVSSKYSLVIENGKKSFSVTPWFSSLTVNLFILSTLFVVSEVRSSENADVIAEVQSCRGCALNRLPEVKAFIYDDLPKYEKVTFKPIPGAIPEFVLFSEKYEELERIPLSSLSRSECNELLQKKGFTRTGKDEEDIEEEIDDETFEKRNEL